MDGDQNEAAGSATESGPEPLTQNIVRRRIDYGQYYVGYDTVSKSEAYTYIQKVYDKKTGQEITYWFYCPYCRDILHQSVSVGTTPLLRHVRTNCTEVPAEIREKLLENQKKAQSKKTQQKEKPKPQQENQPPKRYEPPTIDWMADALSKATKIGATFGHQIDSETYKELLTNSSTWFEEATKVARAKTGVRPVSVVLQRVADQPLPETRPSSTQQQGLVDDECEPETQPPSTQQQGLVEAESEHQQQTQSKKRRAKRQVDTTYRAKLRSNRE